MLWSNEGTSSSSNDMGRDPTTPSLQLNVGDPIEEDALRGWSLRAAYGQAAVHDPHPNRCSKLLPSGWILFIVSLGIEAYITHRLVTIICLEHQRHELKIATPTFPAGSAQGVVGVLTG